MAEPTTGSPALSIVVPVYNGAATVGELVQALRGLEIEGGLEIVLVVDNSPDNSLEICKQLAADPGAPVTVLSLSRNFGEHNAVMAGPGPGVRRLRHHNGRRSPEPAGRGHAPVRARA